MTNSTSEREQRVRQIRANRDTAFAESKRFRYYDPPTWDDVNFLLSLLDSEAAGGNAFVGPCVSCGHNNFDTERSECKQRWMEGRMSVVCGCPCAKHNSLANTATRMRDLCVEKMKEILRPYELEFRRRTNDQTNIVDYAAMVLESLTLEHKGDEYNARSNS